MTFPDPTQGNFNSDLLDQGNFNLDLLDYVWCSAVLCTIYDYSRLILVHPCFRGFITLYMPGNHRDTREREEFCPYPIQSLISPFTTIRLTTDIDPSYPRTLCDAPAIIRSWLSRVVGGKNGPPPRLLMSQTEYQSALQFPFTYK